VDQVVDRMLQTNKYGCAGLYQNIYLLQGLPSSQEIIDCLRIRIHCAQTPPYKAAWRVWRYLIKRYVAAAMAVTATSELYFAIERKAF